MNGREASVTVNPLKRLLDVLRDDLGFTGVKEGCGEGECGACSIMLDGRLVDSCILAVGAVEGSRIETIEGIRDTRRGKRLVERFAADGSVQCGFCIPGMIVAADALLRENPQPTDHEIREGISGNLCRCTGYDAIVKAVGNASRELASDADGRDAEAAS